jgi:hypothetical protein
VRDTETYPDDFEGRLVLSLSTRKESGRRRIGGSTSNLACMYGCDVKLPA